MKEQLPSPIWFEEEEEIESDFITLRDGWEFINKTEIVGLRWLSPLAAGGPYRLEVFFTDAPSSSWSGEDAANILDALGLPTDPPGAA